jgi:Cu+-exporting ATPase
MTKCYHCGEETSENIIINDNSFCCEGCKIVFEILLKHKLEKFYELNKYPGIIPDNNISQFYFLDTKKIKNKWADFENEYIISGRFFIPTIHCSSCIWLLENISNVFPSVIYSSVDFDKRILNFTLKKKECKLSDFASFIKTLGYKPILNLEKLENKNNTNDHSFFYKISVSFFCFSNIMLLAFPEYFGSHGDLWLEENQWLFRVIMFFLSIPVFTYSSIDFFSSSYTYFYHKYLHIDIPIALGILTLFFRSIYEVFLGIGPGYFDSLSGLVFFILLGRSFQIRTYRSFSFYKDYKSLYPIAVTRLNSSKEENILLTEISKGDRLLIHNEEIIPTDSILIDGEALIDNSFITGESRLISKKNGDILCAGGRQKGGIIKIEVIKTVEQSQLTSLWSNKAFKKSGLYLDTIVNNCSYYFTICILTIALFTSIYWYYVNKQHLFQSVCAVLIVACPCALAISTPFTLGNIISIFARKGFYIRDIHSIERIAKIDVLVFDKTGTLTENKGNKIHFFKGRKIKKNHINALKILFKNSKHPLSIELFNYLNYNCQYPMQNIRNFKEFPGFGLQAIINGSFYKAGSSIYLDIPKLPISNRTQVFISKNGKFLGFFAFKHRYRSFLNALFKKLTYYKISILSGDNNSDRFYLKSFLPKNSDVFFCQTPKQKLNYIYDLQQKGKKVMMFGDGLNDAGAIKQSDVGVSVYDGNNFFPECDVFIKAKEINNIYILLKFSNFGVKMVKLACFISVLYNIIGLYFAVSGRLQPVVASILMPVSSISVVLFSSVFTWLYALYMKIL